MPIDIKGVQMDFSAYDFFKKNDDSEQSIKKILQVMDGFVSKVGDRYSYSEIMVILEKVEQKIKELSPTIDKYRISGEKNTAIYTPDRQAIHIKILEENFIKNLKKYNLDENSKPTLILLGGRPGSGKTSGFKNLVYDDNFIFINSDYIKSRLPGYQGWNDEQFHEEGADIVEKAIQLCKENKLNIVIETTMGTTTTAERRIEDFKNNGYRVEAHYMFLPINKAIVRATERFLNGIEGGRYMPLGVILEMKNNEANFDKLKEIVDAWSFYENKGTQEERCYRLVAKGGVSYMQRKKEKEKEKNKLKIEKLRNKIKSRKSSEKNNMESNHDVRNQDVKPFSENNINPHNDGRD